MAGGVDIGEVPPDQSPLADLPGRAVPGVDIVRDQELERENESEQPAEDQKRAFAEQGQHFSPSSRWLGARHPTLRPRDSNFACFWCVKGQSRSWCKFLLMFAAFAGS